MLSFGSPGAVTRPPMLAVFAVDVAAFSKSGGTALDSDDLEMAARTWATTAALAIARITSQLALADERLEVAVDTWCSRSARALAMPRLLLGTPGPHWAAALVDNLIAAAVDAQSGSGQARLDALKARLVGLLGADPWSTPSFDMQHPAQSPLTQRHRSHDIHRQPLPELLSRTSDRLGELKKLKGMPPSAVRHHLFLVSDVPVDCVEWTGPNPSRTPDLAKKKLFDALLGKDGLAWAGWTDRRVAVSWISPDSAPTGQVIPGLAPLLSCLGGKLIPMPELCLPDLWIPFASIFGPLRPKRIDREIGRITVVKGVPQATVTRDTLSIQLGDENVLTLSGRRIGRDWADESPLELAGPDHDEADVDPSSEAPCFILDSLPDSFPAESAFIYGSRTFRLYLYRGLPVLLPFHPPSAQDQQSLLDQTIENLRSTRLDRGPMLTVPGTSHLRVTGCTSPMRRTKLTPAPTPTKHRMESIEESAMETAKEPETAADLYEMWAGWCYHAITNPVGFI